MRSAARCAPSRPAIMSSCRFRGAALAPTASRTCTAIACTPSRLKMNGTRADGSTLLSKNGAPVYSAFFQQSSFGTFALTQERYAVKVRKDAPLELLGSARLQRPDRGGRRPQRHEAEAGRQLRRVRRRRGGTVGVDGGEDRGLRSHHCGRRARRIASRSPASSAPRMRSITEPAATWSAKSARSPAAASRYSLETSALPAVFREAIEALMPGGTCVLLGSARHGTEVSFEMKFLQEGRVVRGVVQGDSVPKEFIPKLVDLIMEKQVSDREDDQVLRFRRHQPGGAGILGRHHDQAGAADAGSRLGRRLPKTRQKLLRCRARGRRSRRGIKDAAR